MAHFGALGIETLQLDVESEESIRTCVEEVIAATGGVLDVLINNSGAGYNMPLADVDLKVAQSLFNLNVFAVLAVTNAFLPLLLRSAASGRDPVIVNQTSISAATPVPYIGIYGASKAALAHLTDTMRIEMSCFGINVVNLMTGMVATNFGHNMKKSDPDQGASLPPNSIFGPARAIVEKCLAGGQFVQDATPVDEYAEAVVTTILKNPRYPPARIWKGASAFLVWFARRFMPFTFLDRDMRKMGNLDEVTRLVKDAKER
jgi:1-acylglycerone phosphate reductase